MRHRPTRQSSPSRSCSSSVNLHDSDHRDHVTPSRFIGAASPIDPCSALFNPSYSSSLTQITVEIVVGCSLQQEFASFCGASTWIRGQVAPRGAPSTQNFGPTPPGLARDSVVITPRPEFRDSEMLIWVVLRMGDRPLGLLLAVVEGRASTQLVGRCVGDGQTLT